MEKKIKEALKQAGDLEKESLKKCNGGTKNQYDYLDASYYAGLNNGMKFILHILTKRIDGDEFDKLFEKICQKTEIN